ncbi:hypothetical protein SLEP1_g31552 [Rubroshorea leprosula]|uniref:Uncharacterized protein n=1 Tax=Rubroshorea leprosula TaxID=152421 RepID=A0AAV5K8A6_9ROSI|nr:hypothetical protein SLEP1_g31552 [Rubroshorea leprosula]
MVPVSPLQLAAGFFSPSRSGSAGWKILETKPRTRKPREVTS